MDYLKVIQGKEKVKINGKALDSKGQVPPIPIAPVRKSQTTPCSYQTEKRNR